MTAFERRSGISESVMSVLISTMGADCGIVTALTDIN